MKKTLKVISIILVIMFLSVYLGRYNNTFYQNKNILTEEAILKFEEDLKAGKNIELNNYLPQEKDYNNKAATIGMKISNTIESAFDSTLRFIFKGLESLMN